MSSTKIMKGQKLYVYVNVPKKVAVKNIDVLDNEDETVPDVNEGTVAVTEIKSETDSSTALNSDSAIEDSAVASKSVTKSAVQKAPVKKAAPQITQTKKPAPSNLRQYVYHVVQPGDTLWSIAQRYDGISVDDLKRANNIHNSKNLKPGTKLKIKVKA